MKGFLWQNTTKVCFGQNAVKENIGKFVKPKSKVLCIFGGTSIDKNGSRHDVEESLRELECEVRWEGGIPPNPEYERLVEITSVAREFKPDLLLAIGGGSIIDGTKFIACAAQLEPTEDIWDIILIKKKFNKTAIPIGTVLTIPATGSEWNNFFVISRHSLNWKSSAGYPSTFPVFSLLDPKYTLTLPVRQLQNGVFDAFCHCTDAVLTPQAPSMFDNFYFSIMKELVTIGPSVVSEKSPIELRERLMVAASFALNGIFQIGEIGCYAVHKLGSPLTSKYGVDHGASLAMCMPEFLRSQFEQRKVKYAAAAEFVFNVHEGSIEEKAHKLIENIEKFIHDIGIPDHISKWPNAKIGPNDVDDLTHRVMEQGTGGKSYGYQSAITEEMTREIYKKIITPT